MYSSLSQLGLSGSVTLEEVRAAMQVKSMLIIVSNQSQSTSDYVSDTPSRSGTLIIVKFEPNYYTHAEFIQATDGSSIRYFNLYTVNSGWNGWNIIFLPLKGGILNGEVYINGGYARFVSDNKTLQLETRNGINNTSNRRMVYFRNSSYKDITESLVLGDMVDNVQKTYLIYGSHNITSGTNPLTSGTSNLTSGCIYIQYE